jgi:hypothetical protein
MQLSVEEIMSLIFMRRVVAWLTRKYLDHYAPLMVDTWNYTSSIIMRYAHLELEQVKESTNIVNQVFGVMTTATLSYGKKVEAFTLSVKPKKCATQHVVCLELYNL